MKKFQEESEGRWAANENPTFQEDDEHRRTENEGKRDGFPKEERNADGADAERVTVGRIGIGNSENKAS